LALAYFVCSYSSTIHVQSAYPKGQKSITKFIVMVWILTLGELVLSHIVLKKLCIGISSLIPVGCQCYTMEHDWQFRCKTHFIFIPRYYIGTENMASFSKLLIAVQNALWCRTQSMHVLAVGHILMVNENSIFYGISAVL
jgi:hypothetical protein